MATDRSAGKTERKRVRAERIQDRWNEHYDELVRVIVTLAEILRHSDQKLIEVADLGLNLIQVGKLDLAKKILSGLPLLDPYVPYFHMLLGILHDRMGDAARAFEEYDAAIHLCRSMDPPRALLTHVLVNKVKLQVRVGQFQEALETLSGLGERELAAQDPKLRREAEAIRRYVDQQAGQAAESGSTESGPR